MLAVSKQTLVACVVEVVYHTFALCKVSIETEWTDEFKEENSDRCDDE